MISAEESIPVFAASTPRSSATARIWAATTPDGTSHTSVTPSVFCTVTDVRALIPHTPSTAKVLRSAWTPAPPPESEPAMVRARGIAERTRSAGKVVPSLGLQGPLGALGINGHESLPFPNLTDVGQRRSESLAKLLPRSAHRRCRQRRQQLVVLSAPQREGKGLALADPGDRAELRREQVPAPR